MPRQKSDTCRDESDNSFEKFGCNQVTCIKNGNDLAYIEV